MEHLELEYWNEYLGGEFVFMFKFKDGSVRTYVYSEKNEEAKDYRNLLL